MSGCEKLRLTVVYDFNFYGDMTEGKCNELINRFLEDPGAFINVATMEGDELLVIDICEIGED